VSRNQSMFAVHLFGRMAIMHCHTNLITLSYFFSSPSLASCRIHCKWWWAIPNFCWTRHWHRNNTNIAVQSVRHQN
jgi:hypothetical protein